MSKEGQLQNSISVRTTRLNNLILGKYAPNNGAILKASDASSANIGNLSASPVLTEALNREGLLDAFCLLYNECDKDVLKKRDRAISEFVNKYRPIIEETCQLRVNIKDFAVKALIGKGYFGNVHLVVERYTGDIYAMKKIKKSAVTSSQVKEERNIMARRCSEWLTNLQYAFQDHEHLYLIMEFLPGGDLLGLMSRHGPFDEDWTRFYMAELTMAIHSLHQMGYVHRDIKPENILFDRFGHIKLADFGNAAPLDNDGHVLSLSPVGTPDYIAPELLQTISTYRLTKSTHDVSCDFWSMGIIGYELICEVTPFHEENVHETYSKILSHCEDSKVKEIVTFPTDLKISRNFKNLIESLLTNLKNRLNFEEIVKHPFFENVKWETIRLQVPPIIPTVNGEDDTSNFEDVTRSKCRNSTFVKKSLPIHIKSNDFCGRDLAFIGYSFVHTDKYMSEDSTVIDARFNKLNTKFKELQKRLKDREVEINNLQQELIRTEQMAKQTDSQSRMIQDAKDEITKMKNIIKEKTIELAACKTQIKMLQSSIKVEEEMWEKKEATITELLRRNRQKYEEAKISSEQQYEKLIANKKNELVEIVEKLDARELELNSKTEEITHLQEKVENYKDILRQFKDKAQADKLEFEKNKTQLTESYEQKLTELRTKLRLEKDSKSRLTMELRDVRCELNESIISSKSTEEAKEVTVKNINEIMKRLNQELVNNNKLHTQNAELDQKLAAAQKESQELHQEIHRLERELKVAECRKNLAESTLGAQSSPYETATGSLSDIHVFEDQLRADLEVAKENENVQKIRANKLEEVVKKMEEMLEKFNQNTLESPTKIPRPAPRHQIPNSVGDMLEKQNEKLEDRLAAVREQMIVERQTARTANLSLWKVEKQLEETIAEKKILQRRMELTEERITKVQKEKDVEQRLHKGTQEAMKQCEKRTNELLEEIKSLKLGVLKEHQMWEKAEQERMKSKSEIVEHISNVHKLEERLSEIQQQLQQYKQKSDSLGFENERLSRELKEEHERYIIMSDTAYEVKNEMQKLQNNYERLKYACSITDNQLTEIEGMLEAEQKRNVAYQKQISNICAKLREKDETITRLQKDMHEIELQKKSLENRTQSLSSKVDEQESSMQELQNKLISQQQQFMDQTNNLFETQERIEVITNENNNLLSLNQNCERELNVLKEENARILSELFHSKEEELKLKSNLKEANNMTAELHAEIGELDEMLNEKENFYLQRDIKSEATLAQYKKLIDYLQLKIEDLSQKKKKTLADKLFGGSNSSSSSSNTKENISPGAVESSILYRTLQQELARERQRCKTLQDQIDKQKSDNVIGLTSDTGVAIRQALKTLQNDDKIKKEKQHHDVTVCNNSTNSFHRFELTLQETNIGTNTCALCHKPILASSPFWKCKECKIEVHRKCRSDISTNCGKELSMKNKSICVTTSEISILGDNTDTESAGKFSYEGNLENAAGETNSETVSGSTYSGSLIFSVEQTATCKSLEVNCGYEMEEHNILLLGCNAGLYAYHVQTQCLVHIAGIDGVSCIAVSLLLSKAIMVGSCGESLYQCDFRQLLSRCQANACMKPALEASILDLSFANRVSTEKWQLVRISNETENAIDSIAIAATSARIVIMKYDLKLQKFKPVRALDTATSVSSIIFTRHTAIVSSDKFFEIDLNTYAAEEFMDFADQSLLHTQSCQPVVAINISRQEFLLCFMECGIFVDEFGCRSRPYDLNWEYTPTGFMYREPFLYVSHFQSVQLLRLHRSYTKEVGFTGNKDIDADIDDTTPHLKRVYLPYYMPTLFADSGKINAYVLAVQKDSGLQCIYYIDVLRAFKQKFNESLETISSITTSITFSSVNTAESI